MSGSKINDYSIGDSNIQSVMLTLDKAYKGLHQVSLTNYDTTAESQIAAGSVVENNGSLFKFDSNEAISTTDPVTSSAIVDGTVYIMLVPSGTSITAAYTATAPVWSDSKQGWYGVGAYANNRYVEFIITKSSATWLYKQKLNPFSNNRLNVHSYTSLSSDQIVTANTIIHFDENIIGYNIILGGDYKHQISESGVYSLRSVIIANGILATTSNMWAFMSDSSFAIFGNYILRDYSSSANGFLEKIFPFNALDKVWVSYAGVGTAPNFTIAENSFFMIKKIGEL